MLVICSVGLFKLILTLIIFCVIVKAYCCIEHIVVAFNLQNWGWNIVFHGRDGLLFAADLSVLIR